MTNDRAVKWAGLLMVVVSAILIASTLYVLTSNTWLLLTSESTEGEVIGTPQQNPGYEFSVSLPARHGLVRYQDAAGTEHVFSEDIGGENPIYEKGAQVTVLYHPEEPENARIRDFMAMYLGPALLLPFAAVFWFIGMLIRATLEKPAPRETNS